MLRPLGRNVVIEKIKEEEKNKYGIILASKTSERERNAIGKVVAVSQTVTETKIGDEVLYCKYAGSEFKQDDTEYLIMSIDDILAVKTE